MSDAESGWLQTAPSITSDTEQDSTQAARSVSSIDFLHHKAAARPPVTMDHSYYKGFKPGQQPPPHHQTHRSGKPPLKREPSTQQWSLDAAGSVSEGPDNFIQSPHKNTMEIPSFSVSAGPSPLSEQSHSPLRLPSGDLDQIAEEAQEENQTNKHKKSRTRSKSRERKKKRNRSKDDLNFDPPVNTDAGSAGSELNQSRWTGVEERDLAEKRSKEHGDNPSAGSYGMENPAFHTGEHEESFVRKRMTSFEGKQKRESGVTFYSGEDGEEDDDRSNDQGHNDERPVSRAKMVALHSATIKHPVLSPETRRNINQNFTAMHIHNNIKQRECSIYARDGKSDRNDCQCGRDVQWHRERNLAVNLDTHRVTWHQRTHTTTMPCDSFGEILFRGFGSQAANSPYMRLDSSTDIESVWEVLMECWQLPVPKLLISVTGGAKRFYLKPRLKNILKQGLVNAAVSTGAWLITGGTATGVMEFVGEAVQDHIQASGSQDENECVALGIASWGFVANNIALDGEGEHGLFPATYCMEDMVEENGPSCPLDHNHTHFLLVDNGTQGKVGVEIEFRSKLESYISQKVETGVTESQSVNVPTVLIVVEGGINTMKTVAQSVSRSIPVVVIDGSGRAADFIAQAFRMTKNTADEDLTYYQPDFDQTMKNQARQMFEWKKGLDEDAINRNIYDALRLLKESLERRKLINIFNLDRADSVKDIDRAILYALLKANKSNAYSQLALALAWNRCDIARQEIFTPENRHSWQQLDLYNAMFTALVQNRADFVQLFLDNGVDLKRFLTTKTLWNLYCNCIKDQTGAEATLLRYLISYLKQTWGAFLLCRGTPDFENNPELLIYINKMIVHLLEDQSFQFYSDQHLVKGESPSMLWKGDKEKIRPLSIRKHSRKNHSEMKRHQSKQKITDFDFEHPERELFIWAVLFNRRQLTRLFWKIGRDHLGGALFASALLYRLSDLAEEEEEAELAKELLDHSDECERLAVSVLSECYTRDKKLTHRLLVRELEHWGRSTLFRIAESFELMEFAGHSACQTKLSTIWKGRMALYTSELKIFICSFMPVLVPFIKFTLDPKDKAEEENDFAPEQEDLVPYSSAPSPQHLNRVGPKALPDDDHDGKGFVRSKTRRRAHTLASKFKKVNFFDFTTTDNINIFLALYLFYQAPVTKFFCNMIMYLLFTGLFSYVVLVELGPVSQSGQPSLTEYLTWAHCSTLILEEFRQLFIRDQHSLKYKFRSWFGNIWNRFDMIMYTLFVLSIILRYQLSADDFVWARVVYSITLAMFMLRFMQYFYVEKNMGPKVIMIRKMLTDLMFFFFILVVFVVSFGVAYHANLYPQSPPNWSVLANVLYYTYFQMYGELFLEDMKGEGSPDCTNNETIWREDPFKRCPQENAVVPVLAAVYMILTNILLVNLLIAMFSYTFQTVQDNSMQVWRFYRLSLVSEYFDRPSLAPPLIILNHIFRLMRYLFYHCTGSGKRPRNFSTDGYKWVLALEEQKRLTLFERTSMENYLSASKQQSKLTLDSRVQKTAKRLDMVMEELQMIKESLQQQETSRTPLPLPPSADQQAAVNDLARERQLMDRDPGVSARSTTGGTVEGDEMERLRQTVEGVASQSSAMSQRLSQLSLLLETSLSQQQAFMRARHPPPTPSPGFGVQDLENQH